MSSSLPTSFQTSRLKSVVGNFKVVKGVILSEIDSCNRPIKFAYFVTPCSNYKYSVMETLYSKLSVIRVLLHEV